MVLRILESFDDKYTDQTYKVGDLVEFEEKRAEELLADERRLVEIAEAEAAEVEAVEAVEESEVKKPKRKGKSNA